MAGVYAHHIASCVKKRAARIPWFDGCVCLQEVIVRPMPDLPIFGRNDAGRNSVA
jgi:hypothetical protein